MSLNKEKPLIGTSITRNFAIAKPGAVSFDLEHIDKSLQDKPDDGLWAYASVEVVDSAGDVVVIDGINTSDYHNVPKSFMKILAQHMYANADGEPLIVGRVEEFIRCKVLVEGKGVNALAFRMSWAKDGKGNLTELAQKYKDLFDGGYLDSFSVGMMVSDYEIIKETGGIQFLETVLYEISAVSVPANQLANVIRNKEKDQNEYLKLEEKINQLTDLVSKWAEAVEVTSKTCQSIESAIVTFSQAATKQSEMMSSRLDDIEAGLVVASTTTPESAQTSDQKQQKPQENLNEIGSIFRKFAGR